MKRIRGRMLKMDRERKRRQRIKMQTDKTRAARVWARKHVTEK